MSNTDIGGTFTQIYKYIKRITTGIRIMTKDNKELKTFNMRMPKEMWLFLKKTAAAQEVSMTDIIIRCVDKYKKKLENKLTDDDTNV